MRGFLLDEPSFLGDKILESHVVSRKAMHLLDSGDVAGFFDERRRDLIAMERRFIEGVGLSYAEHYETVPQA